MGKPSRNTCKRLTSRWRSSPRLYLIYDARACGGGDTDDALILDTADSDREAREVARSGDHGAAVACYSCRKRKDVMILDDERHEWDWHARGGFSDR